MKQKIFYIAIAIIVLVALGIFWAKFDGRQQEVIKNFTVCISNNCFNTDSLAISKEFNGCLEVEKMVLCPGTEFWSIKLNK